MAAAERGDNPFGKTPHCAANFACHAPFRSSSYNWCCSGCFCPETGHSCSVLYAMHTIVVFVPQKLGNSAQFSRPLPMVTQTEQMSVLTRMVKPSNWPFSDTETALFGTRGEPAGKTPRKRTTFRRAKRSVAASHTTLRAVDASVRKPAFW